MEDPLVTKKKKFPTTRRAQTVNRALRDALARVDALMAREHWVEAQRLLDKLNRTCPQRPEILQPLVEVAFHLNDAHLYHYGCERLYTLRPHDRDLPYMLSRVYVKNGWLALALTMAR